MLWKNKANKHDSPWKNIYKTKMKPTPKKTTKKPLFMSTKRNQLTKKQKSSTEIPFVKKWNQLTQKKTWKNNHWPAISSSTSTWPKLRSTALQHSRSGACPTRDICLENSRGRVVGGKKKQKTGRFNEELLAFWLFFLDGLVFFVICLVSWWVWMFVSCCLMIFFMLVGFVWFFFVTYFWMGKKKFGPLDIESCSFPWLMFGSLSWRKLEIQKNKSRPGTEAAPEYSLFSKGQPHHLAPSWEKTPISASPSACSP